MFEARAAWRVFRYTLPAVLMGACLPLDLELEALLAPEAVGNAPLLRDSVLAALAFGLFR